MGGNASAEPSRPAVDRAGLGEAEYEALRQALRVEKDAPQQRIDLTDFVSNFPPHLRPLVQPVFFQLGRERVGEPSVGWPVLVAGLSAVVHHGATWRKLLEAWAAGDGQPESGPRELTGVEAELYLELAASLCFYCALPGAAPAPVAAEEAGGDAGGAGCGSLELAQMLDALRPWAATAAGSSTTLPAFAAQLEAALPQLPGAVGPRLAAALLGGPSVPEHRVLAESRILGEGLSLLLRSSDARLWASGDWEPLYRDWADGRSFNALLKGALHYEGPALLLVRTSRGEVLGALSTCWEDGNGKFGGSPECFLFALAPALSVLRSGSRSGNHSYLNARNKHALRGLGFGGQMGFFRLWLDADFEDCYVLQSDATYGSGQLIPGEGLQTHFQASVIEVWACGGEEAREAQAEQRRRTEGVREQARKVDRAKLIENEFDKEMFFQNTFKASEGSDKASAT